ncbi:MarR family transcriptional regulator [Leptospira gomenensis]|uniref:MarR family transcriptional regulator n=1 Tax=Leptospira gomenensis TaxID=2484974 RepID=A0A5F1YGZ6_9LEPT|nr:MarR family winged helix-turn-helix transcriptional regulator [Leptospira gomenensis]TGK39247.1 MarR family transcriptional regulator [Leptospira gomenensis]TGK48917.1 MarR family transcriptional regulator [Leptospira gomenensis]TGK54627.1 MarR family transcriptional regulator [Leptospira gomenensis]
MAAKTDRTISKKSSGKESPVPTKEELLTVGLGCLNFNLKRASRAVSNYYDHVLDRVGLTSQRFNVLMTLGTSEGMELAPMANLLVLDRTTLLRNLEPLESLGYIEDVPSDNKRARKVALTAAGWEALRAAYPVWKEAHDKVVQNLGGAEWKALVKGLRTVAKKKIFE